MEPEQSSAPTRVKSPARTSAPKTSWMIAAHHPGHVPKEWRPAPRLPTEDAEYRRQSVADEQQTRHDAEQREHRSCEPVDVHESPLVSVRPAPDRARRGMTATGARPGRPVGSGSRRPAPRERPRLARTRVPGPSPGSQSARAQSTRRRPQRPAFPLVLVVSPSMDLGACSACALADEQGSGRRPP